MTNLPYFLICSWKNFQVCSYSNSTWMGHHHQQTEPYHLDNPDYHPQRKRLTICCNQEVVFSTSSVQRLT